MTPTPTNATPPASTPKGPLILAIVVGIVWIGIASRLGVVGTVLSVAGIVALVALKAKLPAMTPRKTSIGILAFAALLGLQARPASGAVTPPRPIVPTVQAPADPAPIPAPEATSAAPAPVAVISAPSLAPAPVPPAPAATTPSPVDALPTSDPLYIAWTKVDADLGSFTEDARWLEKMAEEIQGLAAMVAIQKDRGSIAAIAGFFGKSAEAKRKPIVSTKWSAVKEKCDELRPRLRAAILNEIEIAKIPAFPGTQDEVAAVITRLDPKALRVDRFTKGKPDPTGQLDISRYSDQWSMTVISSAVSAVRECKLHVDREGGVHVISIDLHYSSQPIANEPDKAKRLALYQAQVPLAIAKIGDPELVEVVGAVFKGSAPAVMDAIKTLAGTDASGWEGGRKSGAADGLDLELWINGSGALTVVVRPVAVTVTYKRL